MAKAVPPALPNSSFFHNVSEALKLAPLNQGLINSLIVATAITIGTVSFCTLGGFAFRSEEHTSELQSHANLVCRLLLEKKTRSGSWPTCAPSSDSIALSSDCNRPSPLPKRPRLHITPNCCLSSSPSPLTPARLT